MDEIFDKVREHAEKAKDEAAKLTRQVVDKTNSLITQTKLNFAVNETETKIKEIYTQIGQKVYEKHLSGHDVAEELEESCLKIDELAAEAEALKERLAEVKDSVKCPECGEYNKKTAAFCSRCGNSLKNAEDFEKPEEEAEDSERVAIVKPRKPETDSETEGEE